ncbi:MAG: PRC-barrel domain-containing protein [Hyphomicrobiales bacterium]
MKTLLTTTALGLSLAITPAIAAPQTPADSAPATESPATQSPDAVQTTPSAPSATEAPSTSPSPEAATPDAAPGSSAATDMDKSDKQQSSFMTSQSPDDKLASNLIGKSVYNSSNEEIGEIDDLVITNDGRIVAAIVETGSFLGMGGKHVAVSFDTLQFTQGEDNETRVSMNVAQERLNSAPEFKTLDDQDTGGTAGTTAK